jgi:hypothetical protein
MLHIPAQALETINMCAQQRPRPSMFLRLVD